MNLKFDITSKEYKIVLDILHKHIKTPAKIWIFGSRAKHKTKRNSDLDIAIESIEAIPFGILADLEEAFTDASLPYTVDIVELNRVKTEFQSIINQHKVLLTIIGNIPKLRFPEFRDAGEWVEITLKKCLNYLQPTPYLVKNTDYKDKYKTPVLTAGKTFILGYTDEKKGVFDDKLPVIIFDDFTTASKFVDFPFKVKSSAMKILLAKEENDIKFLFEAMQNLKFQVGTHKRHWISIYSSFNILKPFNLKEQQKIAACLTALDDLISAATGRLDALKQHKQGLMQQLFPTEGETVPRLRFPEFRDAGEWVEITLKKCLNYLQPTPYLVKNTDYKDKYKTPVLTAGKTFILGYTDEKKGVFDDKLPVIIFDDFTTASKFVDFPFKVKSSAMKILLAKEENDIKFLFEAMQNLKFQVGTHKRHWISIYSSFNILKPFNLKEQQKIAACLAALDDLIAAQTQKIAKLKTHKRGLMQQLFPTVDETHR